LGLGEPADYDHPEHLGHLAPVWKFGVNFVTFEHRRTLNGRRIMQYSYGLIQHGILLG